jgi:hypothetical protein
LNISEVIEKVKSESLGPDDFQQIEDDFFAVTGGRLGKIDDSFYLVGGHKFMGRYNPMGPDHGPGFTQEYTDAVRKFKLDFDSDLKVTSKSILVDESHLHRRDYNLVPQIVDNNRILMLFSGVFQKSQNLPFLYPVAIDQDTINAITSFQQMFNHYHCATLPIYHTESSEMHTLFFGGIAQFYEEDGVLIQDNDVPFVNTIADVAISPDGSLSERTNESSLPGYLGAGSEFIMNPEIALYDEGIVDGDSFTNGQTIGYIYGGIRSTLPNIFFVNGGSESEASSTIYRVKLSKTTTSASIQNDHNSALQLQIYPNPAQNFIRVLFTLSEPKAVGITIFNVEGRKVHEKHFDKGELTAGQNYLILDKLDVDFGTYIYKFKIGEESVTRKVIWEE